MKIWAILTLSLMTFSLIEKAEAYEGPNYDCCSVCPGYYYVDAAFLYCRASTNNLEYALRETATVIPPAAPNSLNGRLEVEDIGYSWDPGVQVSIGFAHSDCGFDINLMGTYIHSKAKSSINVTPSFFVDGVTVDFLVPLINPDVMGIIVEGASAEWKLDFGILDLIAACCFNPVGRVQLMPNFGLRGAWIEQHYLARYETVGFTNSAVLFPFTQSKFRSVYRAIGFKAGTDFEFPLFYKLNIIGGVGGSLVYGEMEFNENLRGYQIDNAGNATDLTNENFRKKTCQVRGNVESELGLSCGFGNIHLSASYFFALWFDQNDFNNLVYTPSSEISQVGGTNNNTLLKNPGNIQLQGLILRAGVNF